MSKSRLSPLPESGLTPSSPQEEKNKIKTVIIHGQSHKGSTYNAARLLAAKLGGTITEFFLPVDFNFFCRGCGACFADETQCPHHEHLKPILQALDDADVIILASPVYVYHVTGAMKSFLDHCAFRWMVHRPSEKMFLKQAVCVSTAAGAGTKSTNRDMADSLFFWGVPKIYTLGFNVKETSWEKVSPKIRSKIEEETTALYLKIRANRGLVRPSRKTKVFFNLMRKMHKRGWNRADIDYWHERGWDKKQRPWRF